MAKKRTKQTKLSDQIRQAVDASGVGRNQICRDIGIDKATLSRFMSGERGLSTPVLDDLADYLGLDVVKRENESKGGKP